MPAARIKSGDTVYVRTGKDAGKKGKVLNIFPQRNRARVEGVMVVKRHLRKGRSQSAPDGGIIEQYATIDLSNLALVCPKCGKHTRTARKVLDDGSKVRVCKSCNEQVD